MSSDTESATNELNKLLAELDEDSLAKMSDDEIIKLRKKLNPYGRTIEGSDKILTFSYTDLRLEYIIKLVTTGMIGFLNRMCDEWRVPDGVPVVPVYDYIKDPTKLDEFEKSLHDSKAIKADIDLNKEIMLKRVHIKEFLEDMFQYNPDLHVRSAYRPAPFDDDRSILDTPAAHLAIYNLKKTDSEFKEIFNNYEKVNKLKELNNSTMASSVLLNTNCLKEDFDKQKDTLTKCVSEMIPPLDTFHRFKYYYESNYEELSNIVNDLYCDKSCFETAVNPYSWHNNEEEADQFINKHKDEVISTIYKAHSGKWNIIAPYKKVRESVRFFNSKTVVLEEMAKQIESDAKIGGELMKKRIKIKKKKNIEKDGPDSESFLKWKSGNSLLKDMGADTLKKEDLEDECPMDALEVPVFRLSNGGVNLEKSVFYTEAVAPDLPTAQL